MEDCSIKTLGERISGLFIRVAPRYNRMIRDYIQQTIRKMGISDGENPWMREDILKSPHYSCNIGGKETQLEDVLFGSVSAQTRQNVIVITGEKHIGKRYFVKRLFCVCRDNLIQNSSSNRLPEANTGYRIPVAIHYENYEAEKNSKSNPTLEDLIVKEIVSECDPSGNLPESGQQRLKERVCQLLSQGKFLIYFSGICWLKKIDDELSQILRQGHITNYIRNVRSHNLIVFTADSELAFRESFLNDNNRTIISLDKLTRQEVCEYLQCHNQDLLHIVEHEDAIMHILQYPGNLRMFEELYIKNLISEGQTNRIKAIKNTFDFYNYFLWTNIEEQLQHSRVEVRRERVHRILEDLQNFAFQLHLYGRRVENKSSSNFAFSDFIKCGILENDENGLKRFVFPACGYFLAAKQLAEELKRKTLKKIPDCLLENPLEIVLLWTSKMIDDIECFSYFWQLVGQTNCKRLLRAKIAYESRFPTRYIEEIYQAAFQDLKEDFYDYSVLEVFNELEGKSETYDSGNYLKTRYVQLDQPDSEYSEADCVNIKKRSVYYLGISHKGIISTMINELIQEGTDLHLKYHIIRAMVECYNEDVRTKELIDGNFNILKEYCERLEDPIIKSDFCVLYERVRPDSGRPVMSLMESDDLLRRLKETLEDGIYWRRAHAAGALGRRSRIEEYNEKLLLDCIRRELRQIYEQKNDFRNSIKVISYGVEAICEISDLGQNTKKKEWEEVIYQLVQMLDISRLGNRDIEDAYSTIATGIEFLISADTEKPPFNLGGRFRNHMINYQKVLYYVLQELKCFPWEVNTEDLINQKLEQMEEYMQRSSPDGHSAQKNRIRILQLSDCHIQGDSTRNERLLDLVCTSFQKIDLLLITGDLRQYGGTYDETLKRLRQITESLGLEPKDVFMVPGNHDCENYDRKKEIIQEIRENIHKNEDYYRRHLDELYQGLKGYEEFLQRFYGDALMPQGGIKNQLFCWEGQLRILTMNTSLLCDEETSREKLVDILELSRLKPPTDSIPAICISHHPMDDLNLDHAETIISIFKRLKISALLSGDIHRSKVNPIYINPYHIQNFICGKFQGESEDSWSTYGVALYEIDFTDRTLTARAFQYDRHFFVPDQAFSRRPEKIEDEWKPIEIELL